MSVQHPARRLHGTEGTTRFPAQRQVHMDAGRGRGRGWTCTCQKRWGSGEMEVGGGGVKGAISNEFRRAEAGR